MRRALAASALALTAAAAGAQEGRLELKREMTSRGTDEEKTKTTLRFERFLDGTVALLRVDVPFPDEKQDFEGDPFAPRLGDIKGRIGFRAWRRGALVFPYFVELTLPTADPESLGSGKVQVSAAQRMLGPARLPFLDDSHRSAFEVQVQQVLSVAGDEARDDVNTTKLELTLGDVWRGQYTFKLKLKPNVDWVEDGRTGAVAEIEGGLLFGRGWRTWLLLGRRAWGPDTISGTYRDKLEIGLARTY